MYAPPSGAASMSYAVMTWPSVNPFLIEIAGWRPLSNSPWIVASSDASEPDLSK